LPNSEIVQLAEDAIAFATRRAYRDLLFRAVLLLNDTPNGGFDIVTIGSLSGNGQVFLGSANLTIGTDDLSTLFSGTLQDGGAAGRTGGSLTQIGQGTPHADGC